MSDLSTAIIMSTRAHDGQTDKAGEPYITHPLRMMLMAKTDKQRIVDVLHDTKEDAGLTDDDFREAGFDEEIIAGIDGMSRRDNETYDEFIERCLLHPLSREGKKHDLTDNMDITRIPNPTEKDYKRVEKYKRAYDRIIAYEKSLESEKIS